MLELRNITKQFNNRKALDKVSLSVAPGEIHGIVGLNGSGKSTLLNLLLGSTLIFDTGGYEGDYLLDGEICRFKRPEHAIRAGVGMVHQEFALIPQMSVAENIRITRESTSRFTDTFLPRSFSLIDYINTKAEAEHTLHQFGQNIDSQQIVRHLSMNAQQFVEIARELSRVDLKLLLLDEPTAVLNQHEARLLGDSLQALAARGTAILFVSHRMSEVHAFCHRLSVLRDGRCVGSYATADCNVDAITRLMVHEYVEKVCLLPRNIKQAPLLSIENFNVEMAGDELHGIDLDIYEGEIFGITGLSGHGKSALGYGVTGLRPTSGSLYFRGKSISSRNCTEMIRSGVSLLSEERGRYSLLLNHSIMDNIVFTAFHNRGRFLRPGLAGWLKFPDTVAMRDHAEQSIEQLHIDCKDYLQHVSELSGGNQQKVCIAQALTLGSELLFVNEPTRGIDIAAKERILDLFLTANRTKGTTLVVASSELEELRRICDRVAVVHNGRISAILSPDTEEPLFIRAMMGEYICCQ
ncbi:sugar ABC transporter ATP-binding protein [Desulfosediminicola flagellatus]|uniref:sugar ABC transporter ATP-binding protein n=1 Tax=Desulfosediminicola flagellatus TaxID=2569541 RepID=UPI0010AD4C18|nr:sugar ABC transporter ATP-binding protein [Desulfosediminicola flagellatus]